MAPDDDDVKVLSDLLKHLNGTSSPQQLSLDQVRLIARSLSRSTTAKGAAVLCLSVWASRVQNGLGTEDESSRFISRSLTPYVQAVFADSTTTDSDSHDAESYVPFALLLANLFPFAPAACVTLLTDPIPGDDQGSRIDPLGVLLEVAELPCSLQTAFAEMLSQAAGTKPGRSLVRDRAAEWLEGAVQMESTDSQLPVLCAVALSKLGTASGETTGIEAVAQPTDDEQMLANAGLCNKMLQHIISNFNNPSSCAAAVEGLAVLSTRSYVKEIICQTPKALSSILALSPILGPRPSSLPQTPRGSMDFDESSLAPVQTALCYGLTLLLVNLTARKLVLSAEDQQIARLRAMAIAAEKQGKSEPEEDSMESDQAVQIRVQRVYQAGIISALSGLVRADSRSCKEALGRLCLQLVEDKANRSAFIRDGGIKVLFLLVRDLMARPKPSKSNAAPALSGSNLDSALDGALPAAQALAKLIITTPPNLLFPPPHLTTCLNALAPMYLLLMQPTSSMLQMFEALMALTNLASIDPSIGSRIISATFAARLDDSMFRGSGRVEPTQVIAKVEELLLADNALVRRAATELVCNIAGSSAGFAFFSGEVMEDGAGGSSAPKTTPNRARSRLNVLLILANVDDLPTQLAAGGALAILTESHQACQLLLEADKSDGKQRQRSTWDRLLAVLQPMTQDDEGEEDIPIISSTPIDEGMLLRVVIVLKNLLDFVTALPGDASNSSLGKAMATTLQGAMDVIIKDRSRPELMEPATEVKRILDRIGQT